MFNGIHQWSLLCLRRFVTTNSVSWLDTGLFILYISHWMISGSLDFSWSMSILSKVLNYWIKLLIVFSHNHLMLVRSVIMSSHFLHWWFVCSLSCCFLSWSVWLYRFLNRNVLLKLASRTSLFPVFYLIDLSLFCLFGLQFAHLIT